MKTRKFTVIIPTRERFDTLEFALRSVTTQEYENLEIIVSDNYSGDATEGVVRRAQDERVKYLNTGRRVSMSANWDFALNHATGEWVTIIGDDDALLPGCFEIVNRIIDESDVSAVRSNTCSYAWPSLSGTKSGQLSVPMNSGWEIRFCAQWLIKTLSGEVPYSTLPMLYNGGFVAYEALKKTQGADGRYYRSCAPDVYSAVLLANVLEKYAYSFEPFAINGASIHSTGTSVYKVGPKTEKDVLPISKFRGEDNLPFHRDVPLQSNGDYPKSIQALIYESYLQVAEILPSLNKLDPAWQLKVILAQAGPHEELLLEWGEIFSKLHSLDFDGIAKKAKTYSRRLRLKRLVGNLVEILNTYSLDSDAFSVRDVYHASIAAAVIRATRPSRAKTISKAVRARVARLWT